MKTQKQTLRSAPFIRRRSTTEALSIWLSFNHSLKDAHWQSRLATIIDETSTDEPLSQWFKTLKPSPLSLTFARLLSFLGLILGALTMLGALSYAGAEPINIWLILAVFAILPFLITLFTFGMSFKKGVIHQQGFLAVIARKLLPPQAEALPMMALVSWVKWRVQGFSLCFSIGSLLTFIGLAAVKDLTFGWSSTLIDEASLMQVGFRALAAPWFWFWPQPSAELVSMSQFFRGEAIHNAPLLARWWSVIVMACFVYGLLPRMLLWFWLARKARSALVDEINQSAALDRFTSALNRQQTQKPLSVNVEQANVASFVMDDSAQTADSIFWQRAVTGANKPLRTLGIDSWDEDEQWLNAFLPSEHPSISLWVHDDQTPTGELADCLHLLKAKTDVALYLVTTLPSERAEDALTAWLAFAQQQGVQLHCQDKDKA